MERESLLLGLIVGLLVGMATNWFCIRYSKKSEIALNEIGGSIFGDIAGRDIKKNSYLYKTIQAATHEKAFLRTLRHEWTTQDPLIISQLESIPRKGNYLDKYAEEIFPLPSFLIDIKILEKELEEKGWRIVSVRANDILRNGLILELVLELTAGNDID